MKIGHRLLFLMIIAVSVAQSRAGLIGTNITVNPTGRFPDVAYGNGKYLVVWPDYAASPTQARGRFVTSAGALSGSTFTISDAAFTALYPAVTYNQTTDEFLVTWDEEGRPTGDGIYGRCVSGVTGIPVGATIQIGAPGVRSNAAWSPTSNVYLVIWFRFSGSSDVYARRLDASGVPLGTEINVSNDPYVSLYPAVTYAAAGNQFLVTWDVEEQNNVGDIRGRRVDAATGNLLGSFIPVTTSHHKNRSTIAYDSGNSRWLVQFNDAEIVGNSYDQTGQFVTTGGILTGGLIPIAASTAFEGDTLLNCDIDFAPLAARYFSVFQFGSNMGGQEMNANGGPINSTVTLSTGPGESLSMANAADTALNRFLVVWEYFDDPARSIRAQLFEVTDLTPPAQVTNFTITPGSRSLALNWTNPSDTDFVGTVIRWKLGSFPAHLNDGTFLVDKPNTPGSNDTHVHYNINAGVTHFYTAFAYDQRPNYASGATTSGVPAVAGDFDVDNDVDIKDFGFLQRCFAGSSLPYPTGCEVADLDADEDVDGADFTVFDSCLRGANTPPGC